MQVCSRESLLIVPVDVQERHASIAPSGLLATTRLLRTATAVAKQSVKLSAGGGGVLDSEYMHTFGDVVSLAGEVSGSSHSRQHWAFTGF